ncbi:AI-2E family transporter [Roseospira marina]|uniref:AI-2E family transporter n=1 Tax=Roseospira marina TaxID=140057 RepID=A0A5M6IAV6_9PROT|nr:AI-2E family transporter [Roseospira marina]KAA5604859.1 AI-2E family transporter [Roseospira marina]MBB4315193.1 putative PurR-regulated permease PerM [Roseospira marina]MBB5088193.1 putative PurR-regulated permease PerM [Roseospira marina]
MAGEGLIRTLTGILWFGAVVLLGALLIVGKDILVPFAVAVIVWYFINALAEGIGTLPRIGPRLPGKVCMALALGVITLLLILFGRMASQNIADVTEAAPEYQKNLRSLLHDTATLFGFNGPVNIEDLIQQIQIADLVPQIASAVSSLVGQAGLILVYTLFLLVEQRRFGAKLHALFPDPERENWVRTLLSRIQVDIKTYVWIKTLTSLLTGAVSYGVLLIVGVDYAPFWAVVIFLLNYIPTIGSLLGVAFPAVLALVQFDTPAQALVVAGVLGSFQFSIGNILEPRLMGQSLNLSPLVVILSLVIWGSVWGVVGMFLCVPLTGIIMIVMSYFPATRPIAILLSSDGQLRHAENQEQTTGA